MAPVICKCPRVTGATNTTRASWCPIHGPRMDQKPALYAVGERPRHLRAVPEPKRKP